MDQTVFGTLDNGTNSTDVHAITLGDGALRVGLLTYGTTIATLHVPDATGREADVVLGFANLDGYVGAHPYFGAVIGRFPNRIAHGRFTLDGREYQLPVNIGPNSLHGGTRGFDRQVWSVDDIDAGAANAGSAESVTMRLVSPDGDMGYPGEVTTTVTYTVDEADLRIDYTATADAP